jgi:pyruvate formate lyase activating enzyme
MEKAVIFDIQKFSVHDGPGIRTLVFFKGCPLRCLWCSNPESQLSEFQLVLYPEKCIQADRCWQICPTHAISVKRKSLVLDKKLCNLCGKCVETCYAGAWKMFGMEVDVDYVMQEVKKDVPFYQSSGGGVTFGGGEPLLYAEFVNATAKRCKEEGIHTAVETCGYVPWSNFERVLDNIELMMFDIKHVDPQKHKELCGHSNELILDNLKRLSKISAVEVVGRVPVIPGLNDSKENLKDTARFVASLDGNIRRIELLPYHRFGEKKNERLGREYALAGVQIPNDKYVLELKELMEGFGVEIEVGG